MCMNKTEEYENIKTKRIYNTHQKKIREKI